VSLAISAGNTKFLSKLTDQVSKLNSDTFEKNPPTYTSLKLLKNPPTGGDTLFVSSYGLYERLSEPFQKLAESLTGTTKSTLPDPTVL
jgi:alpha-ketoglutarate-dependent taurine dioxygenase